MSLAAAREITRFRKPTVMHANHPRPDATREDARDLLARLYRDIGISAVASALCAMKSGNPEALATRDSPIPPALPRKLDVAA